MGKTIFHRIIDREIPADILFEDEECIVIRDINPVSPTHLLVIPRREIPTLAAATTGDKELLGHLMLVAQDMARQQGLGEGYRIVINCGENAGQTVFQLHVHVLGGRTFGWPPG